MKNIRKHLYLFFAAALVAVTAAGSAGYCDEQLVVGCEAGFVVTYVQYYDGTLQACGDNSSGQLGDDGSSSYRTTLDLVNGNYYKCVSSNDKHTMAVKANGALYAWGENTYGCFGNSSTFTVDECYDIPTSTDTGVIWANVSCGKEHTLALNAKGRLFAAGKNTHGELGLGFTSPYEEDLTQVGSDEDWVDCSSGIHNNSAAIKSDGTLWVWGHNGASTDHLGLGDLSFDNVTTPTQVFLNMTSAEDDDWVDVECGTGFMIALKADGSMWSWGLNSYGYLGLGDSYSRNTPTRIGTDNDWVKISAGYEHTLALKSDGTLWGWGRNQWSQVEGTTYGSFNEPEQIGTSKSWIDIDAGSCHSLAVKAYGWVYSWGIDNYGQLGRDDSVNDYSEPGRM